MIHRIALTLILVLVPLAVWPQAGLLPSSDAETTAETTPTEALIEILEDDSARAVLIDRLRGDEPTDAVQTTESREPQPVSIGHRLAMSTQGAVQSAATSIQAIWLGLVKLPPTLASLGNMANPDVLTRALGDLAFVVVATYALLALLRFAVRRWYFRIGQSAKQSSWMRIVLLSLSSNLISISVVVGAWALGYVIMVTFSGGFGIVGIRQSLYLNAFLVVEISKLLARAVISPVVQELRLVNLTNAAARTLSRWLSAAITILGYGHLLAVPIVNQAIAYLTGNALEAIISIVVIAMAAYLVISRKTPVQVWLSGDVPDGSKPRIRDVLAGLWQVPALLYLAALFLIVATRPEGVLIPILRSSAMIASAVVAALVVLSLLGRGIERGVTLPEQIRLRLPALEPRLNGLFPKFLALVRLALVVAVGIVTLDTLGFSGIESWLGWSGGTLLSSVVSVAILLLTVFALWLVFASWVEYRLNPDFGSVPSARETTLLTLLKNAVTIAFVVFTAMFALSEIGINIAPLIASAGVLGLAIGFGAQKFVQDIITGIFIQFENAINVGDYITVGGISGTVEKLTIRSVSLRDSEGTFFIIPFSSVDLVSNYTRDFSYFICDMGVAYREDIEFVKQAMFDAFDDLKKNTEVAGNIIGNLEWFGLQSFGDSAIILRARIKTMPGYQWGVGRAYRGVLKTVFDERGIEIPFPHQTIYFGEDRDGKSPALNVRSVTPEAG